MKKQLVKMTCFGTYRVVLDTEAKFNPYRVTKETYTGKETIAKYGDFSSCIEYLLRVAYRNDSELEESVRKYNQGLMDIGLM